MVCKIRKPRSKSPYRSLLEKVIASVLKKYKIPIKYEKHKIKYIQPAEERTYTPDFVLPNGVIIEVKGRFTSEDRKKHLNIKRTHPDVNIKFIFQDANVKISKVSKTTYGDWCDKNGFDYISCKVTKKGTATYYSCELPEEWLKWENPKVVKRKLDRLKEVKKNGI